MGIQGIDVSTYQGYVQWHEIAAAGIDFAYVKATEGIDTDPSEPRAAYFADNFARIADVGMLRGAYHFLNPAQDGAAQAESFCARLKAAGFGPADLPPMLDLENGAAGVDPETLGMRALHWLQAVHGELGVRPIVYTYTSFDNQQVAGDFSTYPLWIAAYGPNAPTAPIEPDRPTPILPHHWDDYAIWQYCSNGKVPSISGPVDLDYRGGTRGEMVVWSASLRV